jgi:dCMP deaminase
MSALLTCHSFSTRGELREARRTTPGVVSVRRVMCCATRDYRIESRTFRAMQDPARALKWDRRFLDLSDVIARWSKDPSRGVGAVIVSPSRQIMATGFNGLPRGIEDRPERLERPVKYDLIVHAEMNAIVQCARNGVTPVGSTIYTSFSPCVHCTLSIIQSGIVRVVTYRAGKGDEHWEANFAKSRELLSESGVEFVELARE